MSYRNEPASLARTGDGTINRAILPVRSRKHRVVLESVTQEKKKLRTVVSISSLMLHDSTNMPLVQLSFTARPPPGYTFIPAGHPELTSAMKEFARKGNHEIYAVSVSHSRRVEG